MTSTSKILAKIITRADELQKEHGNWDWRGCCEHSASEHGDPELGFIAYLATYTFYHEAIRWARVLLQTDDEERRIDEAAGAE